MIYENPFKSMLKTGLQRLQYKIITRLSLGTNVSHKYVTLM